MIGVLSYDSHSSVHVYTVHVYNVNCPSVNINRELKIDDGQSLQRGLNL